MKPLYLILLLSIGCNGSGYAEIYKSVDEEGHVTYSSTPSKGAKKLGLEPLATPRQAARESESHSAKARATTSPSDFPRVDSNTQRSRDSTRHKILADELATEEKLLAEARASLTQSESSPNEAKTELKLHSLHDEITLHEKNVSALKTELSHLKH